MSHGDLVVSARPRFGPQLQSDDPVGNVPPRGIDVVDEGLGGANSEEFELAGTGGEATTSSGSFSTVVEYSVPRGERGILVEAAVSAESNGEFRVAANGRLWGPFSGATDFSIDGGNARLFSSRVVIEHKSTDGSATTTQGSIVAKEV